MNSKLLPIWKYAYNKLSDILVPLSIIERQIQAVEGIESFKFNVILKSNKVYTKDTLYAIPYPFIISVLDNYEIPFNGIIPDEAKNELHQRMLRYYNFVIDKDTLDKIDNDPNTCSILNIYNGLVATFDRTEIREIVPLTIPYELPVMVGELWNIKEGYISGDYNAMMNGIFMDEDDEIENDAIEDYVDYVRKMTIEYHLAGEKYMVVYQLIRTKDATGKIGSNDCIWASGTTDLLHTAKECMEINYNTLSLYKQKSKVILVK